MTEKNKKILRFVIVSIVITWGTAITTKFGMEVPFRNRHYEIYGILLPVLSFFVPIMNKNDSLKFIYWSKENIIAEVITLIINIPVIVIMNMNYANYR